MSRKDYDALAAAIHSSVEGCEIIGAASLEDAAGRIADFLATGNPRFDRGRFLAACGFAAPDVAEKAAEYGYRAGVAAGSWLIDGNTSEETARALLTGIEEGDTEILDGLPSSPLSGQWAGSLLPSDVLEEFCIREDDPVEEDVLIAFDCGYAQGVEDEIIRAAHAIID